jgi:hypothetical protein
MRILQREKSNNGSFFRNEEIKQRIGIEGSIVDDRKETTNLIQTCAKNGSRNK